MRTREKTIDRSDLTSPPLVIEWSGEDAEAQHGEIQHGRVRTGGIDIPVLLASLALLLGLYSVTRSADTVDAQQVMPVAEAPEYLCPEGQALRGITRHSTAICTDISPASESAAASLPATPKQIAVATPIAYDWCYRVDVIAPSAADSGCTAALRLDQLFDERSQPQAAGLRPDLYDKVAINGLNNP